MDQLAINCPALVKPAFNDFNNEFTVGPHLALINVSTPAPAQREAFVIARPTLRYAFKPVACTLRIGDALFQASSCLAKLARAFINLFCFIASLISRAEYGSAKAIYCLRHSASEPFRYSA